MKKVQVIDKSTYTKCWSCNGKNKKCKACSGTGKWKEPNYYIIAETPSGQKLAFQSDFIK